VGRGTSGYTGRRGTSIGRVPGTIRRPNEGRSGMEITGTNQIASTRRDSGVPSSIKDYWREFPDVFDNGSGVPRR